MDDERVLAGSGRGRIPRLLSVFVAALMVVYGMPITGSLTTPKVAHAFTASLASQDVQDVTAGLQSFCDLTKGLAGDGVLGQALPLLNLVPGGDSGFGFSDLCSSTIMQKVSAIPDGTSGATCPSLGNLAGTVTPAPTKDRTASISLLGGLVCGKATSGSVNGTPTILPVDLSVDRTVTAAGLNLNGSGNQGPIVVTSTNGVKVVLHLDLQVTFGYNWDTRFFYLVDSAATKPTLTGTATISIPDGTKINAGIGILQASLTGTLAGTATFSATMTDPTGTGQLGFTLGTGGSGNSALAAAHLGNIFNVGFAGSLAGSMTLTPNQIGTFTFPTAAAASFSVNIPDINNPPAQPFTNMTNFSNLLDNFENLTPRDLADGLGHLVQAIRGVEAAKTGVNVSVSLPFMQGSLSDATKVEEALAQFLSDHVMTESNAQQGGASAPYEKPDFASIQDLEKSLNGYAPTAGSAQGSKLSVTNLSFEPDSGSTPAKPKLSLTLGLSRAPGSPIPLDPGSQTAYPGSVHTTYGATTLKDTSPPNPAWTTNQWAGFQVVTADNSHSGVIASNTADTLTLKAPWGGGQPTDGTGYAIKGKDPKTGLVNLGTIAQGGTTFLVNANASVPQATIDPSYTASVTLVLDLEPGVMGNACTSYFYNSVENPTNAACPFVKANGDGSQTVINSLPSAPDRIMVRTADSSGTGLPLFTFDGPIDTQVSIDAQAGFLGVHLMGDLKECTANSAPDCSGQTAAGKHLIDVGLKPQADVAHAYDIPISELFSKLVCVEKTCPEPASLLTASVNGQAYAGLSVNVPQADAFFGGGPVKTSVTMADITAPTALSVDTSNLTKLADFNFDPNNPRALFGAVVKGLQVLLQTLQNTSGSASADNSALDKALNTTVPVLNRSLRDLLAASEGGLGGQVTYGTTMVNGQVVGQVTDSGKSWMASKFKGRAVVVGTNLMTIADNDATHLTLSKSWSGAAPATGTPYVINNELEAALGALTANPTNSLQDLVGVLNGLLGTDAVKFTVNESPGNPMLELDVDWTRAYSTEAPIGFDLSQVSGIPESLKSIVGVQANGVASLNATAELKLGLLFPMTTNTAKPCYLPTALDASALINTLCIKSDSSITAGVTGGVNGSVQVDIGPVAVALGDPSDVAHHGAQGKATVSVGLGDTTSPPNTIESIGTYLSKVGVNFSDGPAVTCPSDAANTSSDPLAVCAALPLYVKGASGWAPVGTNDALFLRLPQTSDPSDTFNLAGAALSGGIPRFGSSPSLSAIGSDIAGQVLDLSALNGGIDGYFQFAQNALNLASNNGKLPLIGHDLQQGSAFLTGLQAQVDAALGPLATVGTVKGIDDLANSGPNSLQGLLTTNGLLPSGGKVTVAATCGSGGQLQSPAATAVPKVASGHTADTTYSYEIVAVTSDGNGGTVAAAAGAVGAASNIHPLDSGDFNTITWTGTESNVTYQIWRSTDATTFKLLKDNATSGYTDNGTDSVTGSAYSAPTGGAPCDPNASVANVTGVSLEVVVGQGNVSSTSGCTDDSSDTANPCLGAGLGTPFDIGIPGLSFSAAGDGSQNLLSVKLGWKLHLKFGIDTTHGFFVCTSPKAGTAGCATSGGDQPIVVGVALTLPASMRLNVAFLQMCVGDHPAADPCNAAASTTPAFVGEFDVALNSPHSNGIITGADLAGGDLTRLVTPALSAAVNIDWDFLVDTSAGPALPGLGGEFKLGWSWSSQAPSVTDPNISFTNVYVDAGAFLSGVLGTILKQVNTILDPIRPVIDVLEAPIPVLSDLSEAIGGPPITLITIAKAFSTIAGGPDLTAIDEVVQAVKFVADLTHELSSLGSTSIHIPLGSFDVSGSAAKGTTATPDNADQLESNITPCDPTAATPASGCTSSSTFDQLNSNAGSVLTSAKTSNAAESQYGFELSALKHPASLLSVLMGKDVELFAFDSGPLTLAFSYSQQFGPVYAPPPVLVVISGSASVGARIRVGFDTLGIREAAAAKTAGGVVSGILDGLYISTTDPSNGQPIPAITLTGTLAAGAEVSVLIISVGIEGGITLTVNLLWNDPDSDGKLRFSEFLAGLQNPLCLFTFSGSLSAFIKLFIDIGISPFDYSFSFDLINITLIDFSSNNSCAKPQKPPVLGSVSGGVLYVNAGNLGGGAQRNDPSSPGDGWGNDAGQHYTNADEKFLVTELHDPKDNSFKGMSIDWQGHHQDFVDSSIQQVEFDARNYQGAESITMAGDGKQAANAAAFDRGAVVFGGSKNNAIKIDDACPSAKSCTVGSVYVDGGTGSQSNNNQINVGDAPAAVAGGPGGNQIQVGNGDDWVDGNGTLTYSTKSYNGGTIVDPANVGHPAVWSDAPGVDGNDTIHVGLGADTVWGGAGNNSISVAKDSPLSTLPNTNAKFCNTPGVCVAKGDTIVGGGGNNHIAGGSGPDTIWAGQYAPFTGFGSWTGVAGDGFNSVDTGPGTKTVYGGSGGNYIVGHSIPGTVDTFYGGAKDDQLIGGDGNDQLYGGTGNDVIIGGHGSSHLEGLSGNNYIVAGGGTVQPKPNDPANPTTYDAQGLPVRTVSQPPLAPTPQDGHNTIIGGTGSNHIYGGDNGDIIYGHAAPETCAPPAAGQPPYAVQYDVTKELPGEANRFDYIFGGGGDDVISGGGGTNFIDSGAGNDVVCGGSGNDTITGHSSSTQVDRFWGIAGNNTIYGGNGNDQLFGGTGDDTVYAGSGNSYIEGGDGDNVIYAGGGNDAIIGGTSTAGKRHNAALSDPSGTPNVGRLFGGTGVAVIVGDNGCIDMTGQGPLVSYPGQPITINSCYPAGTPTSGDGSPNLHVFDLDIANSTLGENNYIVGGQGPSMIFGGLGSNMILGGPAGNYVEGGTGPNYIQGGAGSNDIIGGSSPSYLPLGTCSGGTNPPATICIPAKSNIIYGDDGVSGRSTGSVDKSNAIIADNGQITRAGVFPGWQGSALASLPVNCGTGSCTSAPNIYLGDGSSVPNRTITELDIYNGDRTGAASYVFAGTADDFLFGGPGNDHLYGGPPSVKQPVSTPASGLCPASGPCIDPNGAYGNDYMEGGGGHDTFESGGGQNDMIGGASPHFLAAGKSTTDVPTVGSTMYGGNGANYLVADNGEIDHECGPAGSPSVSQCTTPSTPWTVDPNPGAFGAFVRNVTLWDLPTTSVAGVGGNSELHTGDGYSHAYGGNGNNKILGGARDDYLMGGPGSNCITGGAGSNDIVGGTAPEVLPPGLTTAVIPSGSNRIFADMVDDANHNAPVGFVNHCMTSAAGGLPSAADGDSVVIGNNGDITRQVNSSGVWVTSNNDPTDPGVIQRHTVNLDIYAYPLAAAPVTADVLGGGDLIYGGLRDDIILGGPGGNTIYAGPPNADGSFTNTGNDGNKHIEGGPGSNSIYGSGGENDIVGGVTPFYLVGHDTGTVGVLDTPTPTGTHKGNLIVGGTGNEYIAGDNAQIDHLCGMDLHVCAPADLLGQWAYNVNDHASIRQIQLLNLDTVTGPTASTRTAGIGGDNRIYGTGGDKHLYGENANNFIQGGYGNDYIEGGTGNNLIQGGGGDKDIVGGTSPQSVMPGSPGKASDDYVANHLPSGNNILCSFLCGKVMPVGSSDPLVHGDMSNDSVIVGHNGRVDRCAASVVNGVGTPQGSDKCPWQRTPFGNEKVSSWFNNSASPATGVAQTGQVCTKVIVGNGCPVFDLGSPRTRFTTLLGQSSTETIQAGTDYIEGNIGNNQLYGEDGPAVIHASTPRQDATGTLPSILFPQYGEFSALLQPVLGTATFLLSNECLPNPADTSHGQNIIVGGYGGAGIGRNLGDLQNGGSNDVLCGGNGDDAIVGTRGLVGTLHKVDPADPLSGAVTPQPFSNAAGAPVTFGVTSGPPYGTLTVPSSGNTIYPVRLDMEYVDGVLGPVQNWNYPTVSGQVNQHDLIFGGGGNNTIHGSQGTDFIEGGTGMHINGTPAPCAPDPLTGAAPTPCTPTGDNIIFSGQGNASVEGGAGNADIFGGPANKDFDVKRGDSAIAPKVDDNGNCLPLAFPTITVQPSSPTVSGYCGPNPLFPGYQWANQSYASRFPAPNGQSYDYDPSGRDNGGTDSHTPVFGHVVIGGLHRNILQAQGFGDRLIDPNGAYNLFYVCPAAYGGYQIIRAFKPALLSFEQQLAGVDGAYLVNQTATPPATPGSGDFESAFVYSVSANVGSAYPTTAGHFTC